MSKTNEPRTPEVRMRRLNAQSIEKLTAGDVLVDLTKKQRQPGGNWQIALVKLDLTHEVWIGIYQVGPLAGRPARLSKVRIENMVWAGNLIQMPFRVDYSVEPLDA